MSTDLVSKPDRRFTLGLLTLITDDDVQFARSVYTNRTNLLDIGCAAGTRDESDAASVPGGRAKEGNGVG